MLTPKRIAGLPESIIPIIDELQTDIINSISKKLVKANFLTPSAEWQLYKANQLRISSKEVIALISKTSGKRQRELKNIYTDACKEAISTDAKIYRQVGKDCESFFRSVAFSNTLKAGIKNANELMENICKTTAQSAGKTLTYLLDMTYLQVTSGAFSYQEAIYNAVSKLANEGLISVTYPSGRKDWTDVAVRRAVVTGVGQTTGQMQLDLATEMDCDLVEVTSHLGARPEHALWQGKIYSISGKSKKYPKLSTATGYGTGAGLKGWNCRHDFYPFFEGISEPASEQIDSVKNLKEYENSQRQRSMERIIRSYKRRLSCLDASIKGTDDDILKAKLQNKFDHSTVTLKKQETKLMGFLKGNGMLPDKSRVRVAGFDKSISGKAVQRAKKALSGLAHDLGVKSIPLNEKSNFKISVSGYSQNVNNSISKASEFVVKRGIQDKSEHLVLVNTSTGEWSYKEIGSSNSVGGDDFFKFLDEHPNDNFSFVHNHSSGETFSLQDLNTYLKTDNISSFIASCNNGKVRIILGEKKILTTTDVFNEVLDNENIILNDLRKELKDGKIDIVDFVKKKDQAFSQYIIDNYCEYQEVNT